MNEKYVYEVLNPNCLENFIYHKNELNTYLN